MTLPYKNVFSNVISLPHLNDKSNSIFNIIVRLHEKTRTHTVKIDTGGLFFILVKRLFVFEIFLVGAATVGEAAVRMDLDDSVSYGINDFVVVRGEEDVALERLHTVVYRSN